MTKNQGMTTTGFNHVVCSVMGYLDWPLLPFRKKSIVIVNMWQWDHEKSCKIKYGLLALGYLYSLYYLLDTHTMFSFQTQKRPKN